MATVHNSNVACCSIPPVQSDYTPKGTFKPYGGFNKVYVTGPETPGKMAIVCVYDIFGYWPQTQQGADIIADKLKAQVLMPDFFENGAPWPVDNFPPTTDEDKQKLQEFFGGLANPGENVKRLLAVADALKKDGVEFIGVYGFCWGGKVTILASSTETTPFGAAAAVHPAMLSHGDVTNLAIPLGLYPSKDEPEEESKQIMEIISKKPIKDKSDYKLYDSFHGFAAARADLKDAENKKHYEDLYGRVIGFFSKTSGTKVE
ncbi:Alpha/Beta hydrolase protein [Epithele typhae]|uniref:Alpha/Beta hydrolase protein n=1 Tax=Epithele typhae TaxID=378194 RepID=UPI002007363A|nr:Alpha/Beta hydrolase protein [Epithele typhae]KAH9927519.1 Alpha/Beta hydrolase protein [Epithele typhae]